MVLQFFNLLIQAYKMRIQHLLLATLALSIYAGCKDDQSDAKIYAVNEKSSKIEWKGSAPDHFHVGSFVVQGHLSVDKGGRVNGGDFKIPIASIQNYDLPDEQKEQLLTHLKSPDFFNIAVHPNAEFHITEAGPYQSDDPDAAEDANYLISGSFTMIGQTHQISFPASITIEGAQLIARASFKLNRLKWGMTSYNDPEEPLYLLPDVEIKLKIMSDTGQDK